MHREASVHFTLICVVADSGQAQGVTSRLLTGPGHVREILTTGIRRPDYFVVAPLPVSPVSSAGSAVGSSIAFSSSRSSRF